MSVASSAASPRGAVLLLREDVPSAKVGAALLRREHDVALCGDPSAATRILEEQRVDLLVVDESLFSEGLLHQRGGSGPRSIVVFGQGSSVPERPGATNSRLRVTSPPASDQELVRCVHNSLFPRAASRKALRGFEVSVDLEEGEGGAWDDPRFPLADISRGGCAFLVPVELARSRFNCGALIELSIHRGPDRVLESIPAVVRYFDVDVPDAGKGPSRTGLSYRVGVFFRDKQSPRVHLSRIISEPREVRAVLRHLDGRIPVTFNAANETQVVAERALATFQPALGQVRVPAPLHGALQPGDVVEGGFEVAGVHHRFHASIVAAVVEEGAVLLRSPRALVARSRRRARRVTASASGNFVLEFLSPFEQGRRVQAALDITTRGASFLCSPNDLLPVGTVLADVAILLPDGSRVTTRARVRSSTLRGDEVRCGIEFDVIDPLARARMADAIVHAGRPEIVSGRGLSPDTLMRFFDASGFLYPEKRARLDLRGVKNTMERLYGPRAEPVFASSVLMWKGRLAAHVAAARIYSSTWLLQHLAALPSSRVSVSPSRLIHLAILEYLEQCPEMEWLRLFFQPDKGWPDGTLGTFARRVSDGRVSEIESVQLMHAPRAPDPGSSGFTVRVADDARLRQFQQVLANRSRPIQLAAEDLHHRDGITLADVSSAYGAIGLQRRREVLVSFDSSGTSKAFALVERSSPGINLSELTNVVRLYGAPDSEPAPEACRSLLAMIARDYSTGGGGVTVLAESNQVRSLEGLGLQRVRKYSMWTWHRSLHREHFESALAMAEEDAKRRRRREGAGISLKRDPPPNG